jgi:hypothetical protein
MAMIHSFLNQGELVVKFDGLVPDSVVVHGPLIINPQVFNSFPKNKIQIVPLPYGVYKIDINFSDRSIKFIIYHQNNWQKECLIISINKDLKGSASLYVEETLEKEIVIDQNSFETENIMSWI